MRIKKKRKMVQYGNKKCEYCGFLYKPTKGRNKSQKYCSKRCREKAWIEKNPERFKEIMCQGRINYRKRHPLICRYCGKPLADELRTAGRVLHPSCVKLRRKEVNRNFREKVSMAFVKVKELIGCQICGYNRYGGSLSWHHLFGKDRRIDAKMWWANTDKIKNELEKCILLCRNCHGEIEHRRIKNEKNN